AINGSSDYDEAILELSHQGKSVEEIYDVLTQEDIGHGADLLHGIYDKSDALDGYISIEVPPTMAADTHATIAEAKRLFNSIRRPNVMIKVPATPEGIPAIRALIAEGVNVNVTLIFSLDAYAQVIEAYLSGLEDRAAQNLPLDRVSSVASFFVSRLDTLVDRLIQEKNLNPDLSGKAAVANAKLAYALFQEQFQSERFARLKNKGARVQRPLWASTSTKNPAYPDLLYVDTLIGPDTVNTLPPQTISAVLDHVKVERTVDQDLDGQRAFIAELEKSGISMNSVTDQLLQEGVQSFIQSFTSLFDGIAAKRDQLLARS
ncbi:MAG: transaldolase, partial [Firmicutes bacterium]|nr:transaldolase [Bacillota bacterium]